MMMEKLTRLACYIGWPPSIKAKLKALQEEEEDKRRQQKEKEEEERKRKECPCNVIETIRRIITMLESILLWENTCNSISVVIAFNVLFWGFVVLEVRGFAAAGSAALVIALCYSTLETQDDGTPTPQVSRTKAEQVEKLVKKALSTFESLMHLQHEQPRAFCTALCSVMLGIWLIGRNLDSVFIAYTLCMSVLVGPALILQSPTKELLIKEWDSEIEEFLPTVTEDNLQVLKRAGETGDRSPTPPNPDMNTSQDQFNDVELLGLRMPSHEDGSTDGLELSELELSTGETDIDGIRFQTGHFERGSSSSDDDEALGLEARKLDENNDYDDDSDDDSEFEIIDSREIANLKNV